MEIKGMIEELKGNKLVENAEWFEKNDPEMLDWVVRSEYWGRGFEENPSRDQAVIEIQFTEEGIDIYATHEGSGYADCPSQNQPPWNRGDAWEEWEDSRELIESYHQSI